MTKLDAGLDPITLTTYWNKLQAIVDEATATLLRTAFSRTVTDSWDFSCALFDADGEMVAQGRHGLPSFLGSMALAVKDFLRAYPEDRLQDGDSLITTDPWIGASQINDVFFVTPIYHRGRIVAYAACVSHSPDVGGRLLSADSTEIFEEGFRLPIVKLFRAGEPNDDLFRIIRLNVRVPDIVVGDLLAQLAANTIMSRRLVEFLNNRRLDGIQELSHQILTRSESAMRRAISAIPSGTYHGEIETDGFDRPLTLKCALTVQDADISVDFAGTSRQDEHGINCAWRYAYAEMAHALICICRPLSPVNGATLRPLHGSAPLGTIINARYPSALGARAMVSMFIQALIFRTLSKSVPDKVIADAGSPPAVPAFMGTDHGGRPYVEIMRVNGGLGARPTADGVPALGWPAPVSGTPIEVTENEMPMLFLTKELITDSGGAGEFRGGLAHAFVWRSYSEHPISIGVRLDRVDHPPLGLFGGRPGSASVVAIDDVPVHSKKTVRLLPGQVLRIHAPGSGGYGDPRARDPRAVRADVLDGYVSAEAAAREYGTTVDATASGPAAHDRELTGTAPN